MELTDEEYDTFESYLQQRKPGQPAHNPRSATMADREKKPRLTSPPGIGCFVFLFKPQAPSEKSKSKEPKYKIILVFDPDAQDSPEWKQLKRACVEAAEARFGKDARDKIKK